MLDLYMQWSIQEVTAPVHFQKGIILTNLDVLAEGLR
jgi:hypothetical protein